MTKENSFQTRDLFKQISGQHLQKLKATWVVHYKRGIIWIQSSHLATLHLSFTFGLHSYFMPEIEVTCDLWTTTYEQKAAKEQNKQVVDIENI